MTIAVILYHATLVYIHLYGVCMCKNGWTHACCPHRSSIFGPCFYIVYNHVVIFFRDI